MDDEDTSDIESDGHDESVCHNAADELCIPLSTQECSSPISECPFSPMAPSIEDSQPDQYTESEPNE